MYFIIILTIEINNDNNKNDIVWLITRKTKISEKSKRRTMIIFAKIHRLK
jgi:hypothetical protein